MNFFSDGAFLFTPLNNGYPFYQGMFFTLVFFVTGAWVAAFAQKLLDIETKMEADKFIVFSFLITVYYVPVRLVQTYLNYHTIFREKSWVIIWPLFFTVGVLAYFSLYFKFFSKREKITE